MGLLGHIWQAWRSVLSVIIALGITMALFIYSEGTLQHLIQWNSGLHDWIQHLIGKFSGRGETIFNLTISDATMYFTTMIVFVRTFVLSLVLWVVNAWRGGVR